MKQMFIKGLCMGTLTLFSVPSLFAQTDKEKDKTDKKETQQIIITRKNVGDEKTVIEINGDKVTINGKDAGKSDDVTVRTSKIRDAQNLARMRTTTGNQNWNSNDNFSFFTEDENRAMLGVVTDVGEKGAEITSVTKESAAEKAGLKKGDIITKIGDRKIEDADDVTQGVRSHKPGDKVAVTILRDGKQQTVTAELGKWKGVRMNAMSLPNPAIAPETFRSFSQTVPNLNAMGYAFGSTPRLGLSVQDTDNGNGVKVLEADDDGAAAKAGIKKGDVITHVNDKEIKSTDEITRAIRENRDKGSVRLQVNRSGKSQNIEVKIPRKLKTANL